MACPTKNLPPVQFRLGKLFLVNAVIGVLLGVAGIVDHFTGSTLKLAVAAFILIFLTVAAMQIGALLLFRGVIFGSSEDLLDEAGMKTVLPPQQTAHHPQ